MSFWKKKGPPAEEPEKEPQPVPEPEPPAKEKHTGWWPFGHAHEEQPAPEPEPEPQPEPEPPAKEKHAGHWHLGHAHEEPVRVESAEQVPPDDAADDASAEPKEIRHTINAEETFTLAKDVYDLRNIIKGVWSNREVISRRLNLVTLTASAVFTILYAIFIIFGGILSKLTSGLKIYAYILFGVYVAFVIALLAVALASRGAKTRTVKKISRAMKYLRLALRILSLVVSITAIAFATSDNYTAAQEAWDIVVLVLSIIILIIQLIPLLFGGILRLCRWLMSPVKAKYRFNTVAIEWYHLVSTDRSPRTGIKRVPKKYLEDISRVIDDILIPALGKKYINTIKPVTLLAIATDSTDVDRPIVEGVLVSLFGYATELGYVAEDPCRDLGFEGSVEEEVRKHKTFKERVFGVGEKVGKKALDKFINSSTDDKDKKKK